MTNLKDYNILIDGLNLQLQEGSGIKTYALSLINALNELDANVHVLTDKILSQKKLGIDNLLNEILFFDVNTRRYTHLSRALKLIGHYLSTKKLHNIPLSEHILRPSGYKFLQNIDSVFHHENCFQLSNLLFQSFGKNMKLKTKEKIDLVHFTYPSPILIKGAKKISTIHDLIPLKLPFASLENKKFFYKLIQNTIDTSDLIVTVSEHTKKDVLELFDIKESKIVTTYQALPEEHKALQEKEIETLLHGYNLQKDQYFLYVGNIEPKKNIRSILEAFSQVQTNQKLVIVGKKAWLWENEIKGYSYLKNVIYLDYVPREHLGPLYAGARCFIFPSLYEGFGLPVLEAMQYGCPIITSNTSSLPEIGGKHVMYIKPNDTTSLRNNMESLLQNRPSRVDLLDKYSEQINFFHSEEYKKRIINAYHSILL